MKRQIVNMINFIRAVEPRPGRVIDLVKPVVEQLKLLKKHELKGTFLFQYDALSSPEYTSLFDEIDSERVELGVWLEVVEPLTSKIGIPWRGRFPWDWHAHCGFTVGYTSKQREQIIDTIMNDFYTVFHRYPRSIGSWSLDAHTITYLSEKYEIDALCICKDQWGTDGYNLWGGYYNQGYYPSRNNYFSPAQTLEQQINIPILRMLGSDPIHQYDVGLNLETGAPAHQPVITLEPVYHTLGGGVNTWTDWYLKENFSGNCLSFGYTQVGQENSFGWEKMSQGLTYQFEQIAKLQKEGVLDVETLGETGCWFKRTYTETPASVVAAFSDSMEKGCSSVWYNSKYYRVNWYTENERFWIRDMHLFCENYRERYVDEVCTGNQLQFNNLPIMDGYRWSGNHIRAGIYPFYSVDGQLLPLTFEHIAYQEEDGRAILSFTGTACGTITVTLDDDAMSITMDKNADQILWIPKYDANAQSLPRITHATESELHMVYDQFAYSPFQVLQGTLDSSYSLRAKDNQIKLSFRGK
ncbi:hypothetical protein [Paenibacillus qinlingensis]|uniref:Uncharacterized protein n=1 Tax=Paenibacillus qinlingensis TaxID=1837343 RepID=A0ABU1NRH2_9BACL|nr:hypothetical protein [Paenibacillus qinlingensis]MDR6550049.1 hypothetical protein [Paenibacillus qinlingensis]